MKTLLTFLLTVVIMATPATAVAEKLTQAEPSALFNLETTELKDRAIFAPPEPPKPAPKPKPIIYTVVAGDSLSKIGTTHNVNWQRLWAKNKNLKHPDVLNIGDKITIPLPTEKLDRALPAAVSLPAITPGVAAPSKAVAVFDGSNSYDYGYCTWYVKNKRGATIPNMLGNANAWYGSARALGMAVGTTPQAGAVGATTAGSFGHVVYIESVNKDGTVNISEMNYNGWGVVSSRTASASEFLYIY